MRLEIDIPEHHYNNIIALDSISLGRAPYKGIIMYAINAIKQGKVLEQEPTTKNDLVVDAVSRDVVRKYIQDHIHEIITESGEDKNKHTNRILRSMIHGVNCMPSVTPRKRKGHWVYIPQQRLVDEIDDGCVYETDYRCFCSECGGDFGFIKNEDEFCKFCGADMREVEE